MMNLFRDRKMEIEILAAKNSIQIVFPCELRDRVWANEMGEIQRRYLDDFPAKKKVIFDLSKCQWIDPFPALSILMEIKRLVSKQCPVHIKLPQEIHQGDSNLQSKA